jgi:4-amino-4-deoxy-L-arabinose transferase-like glycosyltransferase
MGAPSADQPTFANPARPAKGPRAPARSWMLIIFVAALLVRVLHVLADSRSPFFDFRGIDALDYHLMAQGLLNGTWPGDQPFFWAPFYPMFLGGLYALVGQSCLVLKLVQAVIGALTCVLVYRVGMRVFRVSGVALIAAAFTAINGTLIYFDGQLLSASLDVFLQLLVVELLLVARERSRMALWWAAGIVIGISAINRGAILLLLPLIGLWAWCGWGANAPAGDRNPERPGGTRRLAVLVALVAPALVTVGWTVLHNLRVDRHASRGNMGLLPVAANMGVNFYLGNHTALRDINKTAHPQHFSRYDDIMALPTEQGITGAFARSQYLFRETCATIRRDPVGWLRLLGWKIRELIHGAEIPRSGNLYAHRRHSPVLQMTLWKNVIAFPAGLIIPAGLCGMLLALPAWRRHYLLLAAILVQGGFVVMFFVTARYRLPAMPLLTLYAVAAVHALVRGLRARAGLRVGALGAVMIALGVVSNWRVGGHPADYEYYEHCLLAQVLEQNGDGARAVAHYETGLRLNPEYAWGHLHLGRALLRRQDWQRAEHHLRRGIALEPESPNVPPALVGLGRALAKQGRDIEALEAWREALCRDPEMVGAHRGLCTVLRRLRRFADAAPHCAAAQSASGNASSAGSAP